MSHRVEEKEQRRQARLAAEAESRRAEQLRRRRRTASWGFATLLVGALVAAAFALPASDNAVPVAGAGESQAVVAGARAPDFRVTDVVSGKPLSLADLAGERTLLFFSEGASCQACLVQAAELENSKALERADIGLVSVTTDPPEILRQVAAQYSITTPLLADDARTMSGAYGQLGRGGMGHPDTDGHSFVLLDRGGRVAWQRAYQEMYVPTPRLLADMGV